MMIFATILAVITLSVITLDMLLHREPAPPANIVRNPALTIDLTQR